MDEPTRQRVAAPALPAVRLEHLWIALALCLTGVFISLTPTLPNDFWWHLSIGRIIAESGIPDTNMFAWTLPADAPFVYQSWLGELLFYRLYQLGGLPMVIFARNLLGTAAFGMVAYEAHRRSGSWRLAALAVLFAAAMTINNFTTRTQNWSWLPFALYLSILGAYVDRQLAARWLWLLPLIMLFWVNAHGAFTMGILVSGAFVVGETLSRLLRRPEALNWRLLRPLYLALGGILVATLVNPLGPGIYAYVLDLLTDAPSQRLINEWQSPTPRSLAGAFFYAGVLAVIVGFGFGRRRPGISAMILVCGLAWQAFLGVRYVVWFGMAIMPIMVQSFGPPRTAFGAAPAHRPSRREGGAGGPANGLVLLALLLAFAAVQPWFKPALQLPAPYQNLFVDLPGAPLLFTTDTPVAATEHLRAQPCGGNLLNELGQGSYLAWRLYPLNQHFIDPRVELFPLELWDDYIALTEGRRVAALLAQYDIACVILDRGHQPALAAAMPQMTGWQQTFADERSAVWRR